MKKFGKNIRDNMDSINIRYKELIFELNETVMKLNMRNIYLDSENKKLKKKITDLKQYVREK